MSGSDDATDGAGDELERTFELLAEAIDRHDPVPASARRFAIESQRLLRLESELAEIVSDSLVSPLASRSTSDTRSIVFESDGIEISVEVTGDEVSGQVEPALPDLRLALQTGDGELTDLEVNRRGWFRTGRRDGRVRLVVESGVGRTTTDWLRL
ncbi:hypothetical protein [Ilumatobacter sp.]|uniref:hypothetical protein n=1 Tax=Ilumatobacter sp. TaxID=1967498 RepID=UPI003B52408C